MFVGLILVLVLTIALAVYIKKTGFLYKIKAASCGRRNYDCGYQEIKDWIVSFMKVEMDEAKFEKIIQNQLNPL